MPSVAELSRNEAVALFTERARSVLPHFASTRKNATAIAAICRHLDGLPLAIELAAARIRSLHRRLSSNDWMPDSRCSRAEHGTFRTPTDPSQHHRVELRTAQRRGAGALRPSRCLAGGCRLEAAEVLCGDLEATNVLEQLDGLVGQSLLQFLDARAEARGSPCSKQSTPMPANCWNPATTPQRYEANTPSTWRWPSALVGGEQVKWIALLRSEHDNLRAALDWATGVDGDKSTALRIASALWPFWELAGLLYEGQHWLLTVLAHADTAPSQALMRACSGAGTLAWASGDDDEAVEWHRRALDRHAASTTGRKRPLP